MEIEGVTNADFLRTAVHSKVGDEFKLFKEDVNPKYILHWLNSPYGTEKATKYTYRELVNSHFTHIYDYSEVYGGKDGNYTNMW